jgi:hypothetical protein
LLSKVNIESTSSLEFLSNAQISLAITIVMIVLQMRYIKRSSRGGNTPLLIFTLIGVPFTILNPIARLMLEPGTIDETRLMLSTWIGAIGMIVATVWSTGTHERIRRWCRSKREADVRGNAKGEEAEGEMLLKGAEDRNL